MFHSGPHRLFAFALLLFFIGGCGQLEKSNSNEMSEYGLPSSFANVLRHLEHNDYMQAYRSLLAEQNRLKTTDLGEVQKLNEIRKFLARRAFEDSMTTLRRSYYQANQWAAQNAANDANFICEMEGFSKPDFLVTINQRLKNTRQDLYYIFPPNAGRTHQT